MTAKPILMRMAVIILFIMSASLFPPPIAYSQTTIQCGQIIEGEFGNNMERHVYHLTMEPREKFDVKVKTAGDFLKVAIAIYGPTNIPIKTTEHGYVAKDPSISSGTLSARGIYKIQIANTRILNNMELSGHSRYLGGVGVYEMHIYCTKQNGKVQSTAETQNINTIMISR